MKGSPKGYQELSKPHLDLKKKKMENLTATKPRTVAKKNPAYYGNLLCQAGRTGKTKILIGQ